MGSMLPYIPYMDPMGYITHILPMIFSAVVCSLHHFFRGREAVQRHQQGNLGHGVSISPPQIPTNLEGLFKKTHGIHQ